MACIAAKFWWCGGHHYDLVKDMATLAAALPAAILAGAYQSRSSFLQQLRDTWKICLDAVQDAIQFSFLKAPTEPEFSSLMRKICLAIDDFRSLYVNLLDDGEGVGYYPFEGLKNIKNSIDAYYRNGDFSPEAQLAFRNCIIRTWKKARKAILADFDRPEPSSFDSPFV